MSAEFLAGWSVNLNRDERKGLIKFIQRHNYAVTSQLLVGSVLNKSLLTASFLVEMTTITRRYGTVTDTHFVVGSGLVNPFTEITRIQFNPDELLKALLRPSNGLRLALSRTETDLIIGDNANSRALYLVPVTVTVDRK